MLLRENSVLRRVSLAVTMESETDFRARIESSRKELLDLSLRNALLNYRPLSARGVEVVGENVTQVFTTLVDDKRSMTFQPAGEDDGDGTLGSGWAGSEVVASADQKDRGMR